MAINSVSSRLRLTGLSSNMDTESIIKNSMKLEQMKYDKQWKIKAKLEFRQEALTKMQNLVKDFRNDFFSQISKNNSVLARSTFMNYTTTTDDKNDALSAKAINENARNLEITRITQLAKGATAASNAKVSAVDIDESTGLTRTHSIKLTDKLGDLMTETALNFEDVAGSGLAADKKITFSINGREFTFSKEDTLQKVINTVNGDPYANVTMTFSTASDKLSIVSKTTGSSTQMILRDVGTSNFFNAFNVRTGQYAGVDAEMIIDGYTVPPSGAVAWSNIVPMADGSQLDLTQSLAGLGLSTPLTLDSNGKISFSINGKGFEFGAAASMQDIMDAVNADTDANVTMAYSTVTKKISVTNKATGEAAKLNLQNNDTCNFFNALTITTGDYPGSDEYIAGTYVYSATNTFELDGMEYTLKKTTDAPISVTSKLDVDKIVDAVSSFVEGYNKLIVAIQGNLNTKVVKGFEPLTDEERGALTEYEAKLWDEKVKAGLMYNDRDLKSLVENMRAQIFTKVGGAGKSLADIGIRTIKYVKGDYYGTLEIDETKLRAAIEANPSEVADMFTKTSTSANSTERSEQTGYAQKLYNMMNTYTNNTVYDTYQTYSEKILNMEKSLESMLEKLYKKEEQLYAKYAAMETALSKLNSQSDWIASQLGSM